MNFAAAGIALVYGEALPGAKIDGCAFMLDDYPVVEVSGRGKRLDIISWTLLHEPVRVVLGHLSQEVVIEALNDHDGPDEAEDAAAMAHAGGFARVATAGTFDRRGVRNAHSW